MTFRFPRFPAWLQRSFGMKILFAIPVTEKVLFLSFDDGPNPATTPILLNILDKYAAKATFFCVGENVKRHLELFHRLIANGHAVGNHSMRHCNGWKTPLRRYLCDIEQAQTQIRSPFFRPPYGKMTLRQYWALKKQYRIVLWTTITYDFDRSFEVESCFRLATQKTKAGDILVFHDNPKSIDRTSEVLERTLAFFHRQGFRFEPLRP